MYYPFVFEPIYKTMPWGGTNLNALYRKNSPFEKTGESWDITCRDGEMGVIANGSLRGERFIDVIKEDPAGVLGGAIAGAGGFPLLIKLIDANDFLSVQVHPDDAYARRAENYPQGKNEMWYCLSAEQGAYLYLGLKAGVSRAEFKNAVKNGAACALLNKTPVREGDIINIPAGLVHAIGKGIIIAEIQQNSDITYRVFDYNRTDGAGGKRELHINKALDVIDFTGRHSPLPAAPKLISSNGAKTEYLCVENAYFAVHLVDIREKSAERGDPARFCTLTCVKGEVEIKTPLCGVSLLKGDSAFIPAALGEYEISGEGAALRAAPRK